MPASSPSSSRSFGAKFDLLVDCYYGGELVEQNRIKPQLKRPMLQPKRPMLQLKSMLEPNRLKKQLLLPPEIVVLADLMRSALEIARPP